MKKSINYSLCWEDSDILKLFNKDGDRILLVGSGGCIALSALYYNNINIDTVEINSLQNRLIRLKICAFQNLSYDDCMFFLGTFSKPKKNNKRLEIYNYISSHLSYSDNQFWKSNKTSILFGLIHAGKWERYLQVWSKYFLHTIVGRKTINEFILSKNIYVQQKIYNYKIDRFLHQFIFKIFNSKLIQSRFGRHPDLLKFVKKSPGDIFYQRLKKSWCEVPVKKNYFFRYILESHYRESMSLPDWAKKNNYNIIKNRLTNISIHPIDMVKHLIETNNTYNMIHLSNITDTLSFESAEVLFERCFQQLKPEGKLLIWNNLVKRAPRKNFELIDDVTNSILKNRLATYYGFFGAYKMI